MKKFRAFPAALLLCAALLSGCTQSNIVTPENGGSVNMSPDMEKKEDVEINWGEINETLRDEFIEPYGVYADYVMDLRVEYDDDADCLLVLLPVTTDTTGEIAVSYAQDVLRLCGEEIATQDFSYTAPEGDQGYGSYFDSHDVKVQVFPYSSEGDESTYYVNDTMKAGEQRSLVALK